MIYFTISYFLIMFIFFIRDKIRIDTCRNDIITLSKDLDKLKTEEVESKLNILRKYLEAGWIKNFNDIKYIIDELWNSLIPAINPAKLMIGGLLGTFLGLTIGFFTLKADINVLNSYINTLFSSASLAFGSSILGIIFYLNLELSIQNIEHEFSKFSNNLKELILEEYPPVEASIRKVVKPLENLITNLSTLSQQFDPIINKLNDSIKSFDNSIEKFGEIHLEYRNVSEKLKDSIKDLHTEYVSILNFMQQSTLEKEQMLQLIKSLQDFSNEAISISRNINKIVDTIKIFEQLPEQFKESSDSFIEKMKENISVINEWVKNLTTEIEESYKKIIIEFNNNLSTNFAEINSLLKDIYDSSNSAGSNLLSLDEKLNSNLIKIKDNLAILEKISDFPVIFENKIPDSISNALKDSLDGKIIDEIRQIKDIISNLKISTSEAVYEKVIRKLDDINETIKKKRFTIFGS